MHGKPTRTHQTPTSGRRRVGKSSIADRTTAAHILVADGDPCSRVAREEQLRTAGFRVSVARTGFEAIVKASCQMPDLILLDASLGELDTSDTSRLLATCPVTAHIPILSLHAGRRVPQRVVLSLRRRLAS